jgi:phage tail sheath protein FI
MTTNVTYPGVYMQEVPSGVRPIEMASTSTAAFFGVAERGPIGEVRRIFNFTQFQTLYGGFLRDHYLAHAVFQFFNNGGTQCYIGRVAAGAVPASVTVLDRGGTAQDSMTIAASSPGLWGNHLQVVVDSATAEEPGNLFDLSVSRFDPNADEQPVQLELFEDLSMDPASPAYIESVVNAGSNYIRVTANKANTNQVAGFSESGAIDLTGEILGANQRKFRMNMHGEGFREVDLSGELAAGAITALEDIREALQATIQGLAPLRDSTPATAYSGAAVTIQETNKLRVASGAVAADSRVELLDADDPLANAAGALNLGRRNGGLEVRGSSAMRPRNSAAEPEKAFLLGDDTVEGAVSAVKAGTDGAIPQDGDYSNALRLLDPVRDVSLIAIPGIGSEKVADAAMAYCRNRPLSDCFYIADMAKDDQELDDAIDYRDTINTPNSHGAVYFPWLHMLDPTGTSPEPILVPPSGFVAGLYAQIDARRGVWKAPAGTEALVGGAVGLAADLTDVEQGVLNKHPKSVCAIRRFPASGIVLWGARTLSSDAEYKYIPIRRTAIMLRVSIFNGIGWAVFEPNDETLWGQLRLNIGAFMNNLFRQGAFQGATPAQAFFVKCDAETTTQGDRDLGIVNVLVGFAPLKPAEFVVVKISQLAGQA